MAAAVLRLANAERAKAGLAPLSLEPRLQQEAQGYAQILATGSCFAHTCGPVPDLRDRASQAGYTEWAAIGENIAGGYQTPEAVMAGWMASPDHQANILNGAYTEIGIGFSSGPGPYKTYWDQEFGARHVAVASLVFQRQTGLGLGAITADDPAAADGGSDPA